MSILTRRGIVREFRRELEMQTECSAMFDARCPDASGEDMDYCHVFEESQDTMRARKVSIAEYRGLLIEHLVKAAIESGKSGRLRPSIEYTVKDIFTSAGDNRFHVFEVRSGQA